MSVLQIPRIYFKGNVSWDPVTTNNYHWNYDETDCTTILPQNLSSIQDEVQAFRDIGIAQVETGNWNPHGTYRSSFYDTTVCGFDTGKGTQTDDPFATSAVKFTGMLVDLEPFGTYSSQLYFDSMLFGVEGGYSIQLPRSSRITARQINFGRNTSRVTAIAGVASVIWTTCFAKGPGLKINALDSAVLAELNKALEADDVLGLTVRFNAYRTVYYDDPLLTNGSSAMAAAADNLHDKIIDGGFQPNPARSMIVGVLGLWRKNEPMHEPGDRALIAVGESPAVGTASARCNGDSLVIDLSNSVPEVNAALMKQDLGTLSVVALDSSGKVQQELGSIRYPSYDRTAYEASAGLVTLALQPGMGAKIAGLDLQIYDKNGPILQEQALRAIPAEPNFYIDQNAATEALFQVYEHGVPVGPGVAFQLNRMSASGNSVEETIDVKTDEAGIAKLPLSAAAPGITAYVPSFPPQQVETLSTQLDTYMYVRVIPADAQIAALPPTWPNVYRYVLSNWNAMAPCMDNWLRLDDPDQIRAYASILKRLTDPAAFEFFRYMPVTRDMSEGMRTLLYAWLDSSQDHAAELPSRVQLLNKDLTADANADAVAAIRKARSAPKEKEALSAQTRLSQSFRGGPKGG
ncbi:hypothetical protein LFL96_19670 [Paraburkholderia sp. D15]|uniref:hypothetical protein n=1 Tax=Paraburkholderia sp. D15 TaxID=2880218 RepID=UPI00247AD6D4|nr:hypothetical protein [Paraburkholderia sp. D15]WGS53295.1 hypothetical protein LFL96_19670 [Paraburkholderia sp. D15]